MMKSLITAAALLLPCSAFAASSITGTVKDSVSGTPLGGAIVSIMAESGKDPAGGKVAEIRYQQVAGNDGTFTVQDVAPGTYTATVTYPGYKPVAKTDFGVSQDHTTPLEFALGRY